MRTAAFALALGSMLGLVAGAAGAAEDCTKEIETAKAAAMQVPRQQGAHKQAMNILAKAEAAQGAGETKKCLNLVAKAHQALKGAH